MESIGPILGKSRFGHRLGRGPTTRVALVQEDKFTAAFSNDPIVCRSLRSSAFIPLLEETDEISMSAWGSRRQFGPLYPKTDFRRDDAQVCFVPKSRHTTAGFK